MSVELSKVDEAQLPSTKLTQWCSSTHAPTRTSLVLLRNELCQMARAISCPWFGEHGLIGYVCTAAFWINLLQDQNAVFQPIPVPPQQPPQPAGATAAQLSELRRQWQYHCQMFQIAVTGIQYMMKKAANPATLSTCAKSTVGALASCASPSTKSLPIFSVRTAVSPPSSAKIYATP